MIVDPKPALSNAYTSPAVWVNYFVHRTGAGGGFFGGRMAGGERPAFAELVGDAPAGHVQEPGLEGANRRVIFEGGHVLGDRDHRFLHHILRFSPGQATLDGDAVDEFPVRVKKILPARLILPVFEALNQSCPRRNQFIHRLCHLTSNVVLNRGWQ